MRSHLLSVREFLSERFCRFSLFLLVDQRSLAASELSATDHPDVRTDHWILTLSTVAIRRAEVGIHKFVVSVHTNSGKMLLR
jgi:hypothetical protein